MVKQILVVACLALFVLASATRYNHRRVPRTSRNRNFPCSANEIWAPCPDAVCAPKTCDDVGFPVPCYDLGPNGTCPSKPCCICKEGFVRNYKGICIPVEFCPTCGGDPNATPGCGNCNPLCSNYNQSDVVCTQQCFYNACDCKKGFVFDEIIRKCVRPDQCSTPIKCKKRNEIFDPCPSSCPFRTCGINDAAVSCVPALPNGHPDCPPPACRCKDGYYRNHLGNCVLWKNCPRCRRPNEIYDPCPAPCPPRTCDVNEALILCQVPPQLGDPECEPACRCIDGYVRNQTGICIPKDQCPKCTKPNQVYDPCIAPCPPRRCDVDVRVIRCAAPPKVGDPLCEAGCRCADGYVTNSEGDCIPKEECPTSCNGDPNAVTGCGVYCNQRCRDIGKKPGACILICYPDSCDCQEGYFLDENIGMCVPPQQCSPQCPINEIYSDCIQGNCSPQKCSQLGFPVPCPKIDPKFCKKGCLCKEGYVRNYKGVCIPKSECRSCGGDRNKIAGCGVYCNQRCSDIGKEPQGCIEICYENACNCREGYYLDENSGLCVSSEKCPRQCPINEVYSNCIQGNCSPQNCSQLGFPIPCPRIDPKFCKAGCLCQEGFVRNDKGVCIPKSECSSCGGDKNKIAGCGVYCNQLCSDIGKKPRACIEICNENACTCRKGFYLDENTGLCVLPKQCLTETTPGAPRRRCKPTSSWISLANSITKFERGNQALAGQFLYYLLQSRPGENFMVSGFSVLVALAQLALRAKGKTSEQLMNLLKLDKAEIRAVFPALIKNYKEQQEVIITLGVKIYSDELYSFSEQFVKESIDVFGSEAETLNFRQGKQAADTINSWVEDNTNGLIKNLVDENMFNQETRCVLVNALYFLGNWEKQFNKDNTQPRDFYVDEANTVSKNTMYQEGKFRYAESEELGCQILELPYKQGNFSLRIYLPYETFGLQNVIEKLRDPDNFANSMNMLKVETVRVYLPVMDFDTNISDLPDLLRKVNLTAPFDKNSNDLSDILATHEPLYISNAIQKTKIKVDEKGTEAAAATAIMVSVTSVMFPPPEKYTVDCNHPFAFSLQLKEFPMFYGVYSGHS